MARERVAAFAPGRVNLIGEHTDYNGGLALPFAIDAGVTVRAERASEPRVEAYAADVDERDAFALTDDGAAVGWRAFVRGVVHELRATGVPVAGARLEIGGDVPRGSGLSSSAALEVSLCLALIALGGAQAALSRLEIARLCARVESRWAGVQTGLLDQLASLCGQERAALLIDFSTLRIEAVAVALAGWRLVVIDSGQRHTLASSGYNQRRAECQLASELLGVPWLSEAAPDDLPRLPEPLRARAEHVLSENQRVVAAVQALRDGELGELASLLNASHASLRDRFDVSTDAVERTVAGLLQAGAAGARLIGGGFGGSVLGLFPPSVTLPGATLEVRPAAGARLLAARTAA
ncbi:MAG TPA: galactokinase [Solirubrobacteraceae bacterium]|nr:galactokinase [Solirubrobacteraceae bacterium]